MAKPHCHLGRCDPTTNVGSFRRSASERGVPPSFCEGGLLRPVHPEARFSVPRAILRSDEVCKRWVNVANKNSLFRRWELQLPRSRQIKNGLQPLKKASWFWGVGASAPI